MHQDRGKDFKQLCRAAAHEMDPDKLMILVAEIIEAFDERECKRNSATEREKISEPPNEAYSSSYGPEPVGSTVCRYLS